MTINISKSVVERAARLNKTDASMAKSLGVSATTIPRWCERFGVQPPSARNARRNKKGQPA